MSNSKRRGIRIGHYRITPLGVGVLVALLAVIIAAVVLLVGGTDFVGKQTVTNTPAPTAVPTVEPTATVEAPKATAAPTPKPTATPEPEPEVRSATVRVLGEIVMELDLLKSAYNPTDKTFDFSPMFSEIAGYIGDADYTIADVEGTLGDTKGFAAEQNKHFTPSSLLTALADSGVDMLMLANDHALDGGFEELKATITNVTNAGMAYAGAAATAEEKSTPVVKEINGIKVGFAAYCEKLGVKAGKESAAVNLISASNAAADIQALRTAGAEVIVAMVNWGDMYTHTPNSDQAKIAQVLVNAGTDVIIGFNPQAVQPAMWLEGNVNGQPHRTLCLCAPGTLLSNQRKAGTDCGLIFEFTLTEQEDGSIAVESPKYIPTYVLRYADAAKGVYQYRAVPMAPYTGETVGALPEGMAQTDVTYMQKLWTAMQNVMGTEVAALSAE